jgi:hypothetical protein
MKIRSAEEFHDIVNEDFAWRRKELSKLLSDIEQANPKQLDTTLRAGIVLLYAHWEGFIKNIAEYYLIYIDCRKHKYSELKECFIAISLKNQIRSFIDSNKSTIHTQCVDFILNSKETIAKIPTKDFIRTGSNLNSTILREILTSIGIDFTPYDTKSNIIDKTLLRNRNTIAHGHQLEFDKSTYIHLHQEITNLLNEFKNVVCNAVLLKEFIR